MAEVQEKRAVDQARRTAWVTPPMAGAVLLSEQYWHPDDGRNISWCALNYSDGTTLIGQAKDPDPVRGEVLAREDAMAQAGLGP